LLNSPQSKLCAGFLKGLVFVFVATLAAACAQQHKTEATTEPTPQAAASSASPIPWKTIEPPTQVGAPGSTPTTQPRGTVKSYKGTGVIRSINLKEGWFEIDHEEIEGFMAAMQMEWSVKDRALLKSVRVGDRVDFTVEDDNGSEVVTELKKKAPAAR
jgi:Cu(I)/Ag(I) efflux system periplasmic protein CusF